MVVVIIIISLYGCKEQTTTDVSNTGTINNEIETPTGLQVLSSTSTNLTITWYPVKKALSYQLYYDVNANGLYANQIYSGTDTICTHSGLTSNTSYYYKVRALNSIGLSELSSTVSGKTSASTQPPNNILSAPTGLTTTSGNVSLIRVSWIAVNGATSYQASMSNNILMTSPVQVYDGSAIYFNKDGLSSGTTYYFSVKAINSLGTSTSSFVSGTTRPAIPTGVVIGSATTTSLKISWNNVVGGSRYEILRSQSSNMSNPLTLESSESPLSDTGLLGKRTYYYRIRAINSISGSGDWSGIYSGTTL